MSEDIHEQLTSYERAVDIAGSTYPEISRDERGDREPRGTPTGPACPQQSDVPDL